jgi:hypothetical protein
MKKMLFILSVVFFLSCGSKSTNQASTLSGDDYDVLHNLKTVLWPKAYGEQDTVLLSQILHEKFQLIDDEGSKFSKADEMEYVSKYGPSYSSFEFEVKRLDIFDNGTAMVSGEGTMKGIDMNGQAYVTTYQSSNSLIKENGQWKAINSHVSGVKDVVFENAPEE